MVQRFYQMKLGVGESNSLRNFLPPDGIGDYDLVSGIHLANQKPRRFLGGQSPGRD
jgi:hypothetical protein